MDLFNPNPQTKGQTIEIGATPVVARNFLAGVFLWMFLALGLSAVSAWLFSANPALLANLINMEEGRLNMLGWIVMLAPLGFVMLMSFGFARLSASTITALFLLYSVINGISFSFILMVYTPASILGCFLSAAALFGIMAFMGYTTKKDLTSFGRLMMIGLIGIIVAMLINFFLKSNAMSYVVSIIGVMVFVGLTAYAVQKLKRIGAGLEYEGTAGATVRKVATVGALSPYLDLINTFLCLLRLVGGRKD